MVSAAPPEELRIVGGHVALDLVNTVAPRLPGGTEHVDYVGKPEQLLSWARRVDLVTAVEEKSIRAAPLAQAHYAAIDIREATYGIVMTALGHPDAATPGAADELERLNLRRAAASARAGLVLGGPTGPAASLVVGRATAWMIPDRLAHAAVDLLCTVDLGQLRICPVPEGGCGWLFLDRSRNSSRRWCAMADCGSRAKASRLTERRRAHRSAAGRPR